MAGLFLYICLLSGSGLMHPVHVSVINAEITGNVITMSLRTFSDDLQVAYFHYNSTEIDFNKTENLNSDWLSTYVKNNVILIARPTNDTVMLQIDKVTADDGFAGFEIHGTLPDNINSLYIYNGFLLDIYSDQSNLFIFGISGTERGMKFDARNKDQELKLR